MIREGELKMQIALTKKLADAMGIKPSPAKEEVDPLLYWTANWTKVWDNRRVEDMLVLVNSATRFTVAIYQVKRKNLKNVEEMMKNAIKNTLLSLNINPEIVTEYMDLLGDVEFVRNQDRRAVAWITQSGLHSSFSVAEEYTGHEKVFDDRVGMNVNHRLVNYTNDFNEAFVPYKVMIKSLTELTGKLAYNYRAFELLLTLDLEIYKATRRVIVPANFKLKHLHRLMQTVFGWQDYHLHDFTIINPDDPNVISRLVPHEDDLEYDSNAVLYANHTLDEFFPKYNHMIYTYDMGDNWEHNIELIQVIENHHEETPYLLEAEGQTPPEDVGGIPGFLRFYEIMQNPQDPEHDEVKAWVRYWSPELFASQKSPSPIRI